MSGFKEEALTVTSDLDHKFELALDLKHLEIAHAVLLESSRKEAAIGGGDGALLSSSSSHDHPSPYRRVDWSSC
jgi:hypothetical protein